MYPTLQTNRPRLPCPIISTFSIGTPLFYYIVEELFLGEGSAKDLFWKVSNLGRWFFNMAKCGTQTLSTKLSIFRYVRFNMLLIDVRCSIRWQLTDLRTSRSFLRDQGDRHRRYPCVYKKVDPFNHHGFIATEDLNLNEPRFDLTICYLLRYPSPLSYRQPTQKQYAFFLPPRGRCTGPRCRRARPSTQDNIAQVLRLRMPERLGLCEKLKHHAR